MGYMLKWGAVNLLLITPEHSGQIIFIPRADICSGQKKFLIVINPSA